MTKPKQKGQLIIISGPSGVGKGTVLAALIDQYDNFSIAISATTREPRVHEREGVDYYFLSHDTFNRNIEKGNFIEYCEVHGNLYGTLRSEVEKAIENGKTIFLEIDTQGAKKVRQQFKGVRSIFIAPPSLNDLAVRLKKRNTEKTETINSRLAIAGKELSEIGDYDSVVINEEIQQAVDDLHASISTFS